MNIAFCLNQFRGDNIFFMDTKPNSLIDGLFTKINHCDEQFTMNGLFLTLPCELSEPSKAKIESCNYHSLCDIEQELLRAYLNIRENKPVGSLVSQNKLSETIQTKYDVVGTKLTNKQTPIVIKISGVWENKQGHVGLSYRII